jgi:transcriptional regulator with XRE-family HTH domain
MTDSPGDSPAAARQRVRRELRRARLATGLTQNEVAGQLGMSLSKVQRIESAAVSVSDNDLRALLTLFGITGQDTVDRLVADARLSRRERWWTAPEYRAYLPDGLRQLIQFEMTATQIRAYQPYLIPGVLQTPAMAEHIITEWWNKLSPEARKLHYDVRIRRRESVIDRPGGPRYLLILDESVILRRLGSAELMAGQLEDLAVVAARPHISIRIVPMDQGAFLSHHGAFTVLDLGSDDAVLYRERYEEDSITHDPREITAYRRNFEEAWQKSLNEEATLRRITARAMTLRASLD